MKYNLTPVEEARRKEMYDALLALFYKDKANKGSVSEEIIFGPGNGIGTPVTVRYTVKPHSNAGIPPFVLTRDISDLDSW